MQHNHMSTGGAVNKYGSHDFFQSASACESWWAKQKKLQAKCAVHGKVIAVCGGLFWCYLWSINWGFLLLLAKSFIDLMLTVGYCALRRSYRMLAVCAAIVYFSDDSDSNQSSACWQRWPQHILAKWSWCVLKKRKRIVLFAAKVFVVTKYFMCKLKTHNLLQHCLISFCKQSWIVCRP